MPQSDNPAETRSTPLAPLLLRIFWMFGGNLVMAVCLIAILTGDRAGFFSWADPIYWLTVPLILVARRVDITRFNGTTADGEPATLDHWKRHAAIVGVVAVVAWVGAHLLSAVVH